MLNKYYLIIFFLIEFSFCQYINKNTFQYKTNDLRYNLGYGWDKISSLSAINYQNFFKDDDYSKTFFLRYSQLKNKFSVDLYNQHSFKNNFYFYYNLIYNKKNLTNHTNSLQIETSGFGFRSTN